MTYKDLEVFKFCRKLISEVYTLTSSFPSEEKFVMVPQLRRCAISIISNIAEGNGRQYKKDAIQFLYISRGSLYELETQLIIAFDLKYITYEQYEQLEASIESCKKLLNGYINYMKTLDK